MKHSWTMTSLTESESATSPLSRLFSYKTNSRQKKEHNLQYNIYHRDL